jgi:hypothetical protein
MELTHRERLERLRDRLADAVEDASNRDLAPLAARYEAVLERLAVMADPKAEPDPVERAREGADVLRLVR